MAKVQNEDDILEVYIYLFTIGSNSGKARQCFYLSSADDSLQRIEFGLPENEVYRIDRMRESIRFVSTEVRR